MPTELPGPQRLNVRFNIPRRPFYGLPEHCSFIALKALYPVGQSVAAAVLRETGEVIEGGAKDSVYVKYWPVQFDEPHGRNIAHWKVFIVLFNGAVSCWDYVAWMTEWQHEKSVADVDKGQP